VKILSKFGDSFENLQNYQGNIVLSVYAKMDIAKSPVASSTQENGVNVVAESGNRMTQLVSRPSSSSTNIEVITLDDDDDDNVNRVEHEHSYARLLPPHAQSELSLLKEVTLPAKDFEIQKLTKKIRKDVSSHSFEMQQLQQKIEEMKRIRKKNDNLRKQLASSQQQFKELNEKLDRDTQTAAERQADLENQLKQAQEANEQVERKVLEIKKKLESAEESKTILEEERTKLSGTILNHEEAIVGIHAKLDKAKNLFLNGSERLWKDYKGVFEPAPQQGDNPAHHSYLCELCSKTVPTLQGLRSHQTKKHREVR